MITELIQQAKEKYPFSVHFKGKLSERELVELGKVCDIRCSSIYMDGSATFWIRYKGGSGK